MKFLPHSNGVQKLSMRRKLRPLEFVKLISVILVSVVAIGLASQWVLNFVGREKIKGRVDYTRVNDKRMDYILKGEGQYTVIFDGAIGTDLHQWEDVTNKLEDQGISSFVYNRQGYGLSDSGDRKTPTEQANDLKILLRKAGAPAPYILVGEEYGSLVMTEFFNNYSEDVAGIVLINPMENSKMISSEFKKSLFSIKMRRGFEKIGSGFGITSLLDTLGLSIDMSNYVDNLNDKNKEDFMIQRTKKAYNTAVYNETLNLYEGTQVGQATEMFKGKPYYLLGTLEQMSLKNLGDSKYTRTKEIKLDNIYSFISNDDDILESISYIVKEAQAIEKKNLKNNN